MRKVLGASALLLLTMPVQAAVYKGNLDVGNIRIDGSFVYFSTNIQPFMTCSLWGEYFLFDYKSDAGRVYYSALLSAKAAKQKIDVWYGESTAPGTKQNTGCNANSAATLIGLRIK